MHQAFRIQSFSQLKKIAAGPIEQLVSSQLAQHQPTTPAATNPVNYATRLTMPAVSAGKYKVTGTAIIPTNPFGQNNEVNIMFQFRWYAPRGASMENAPPAKSGINTVIIYADAPGLGGGAGGRALGSSRFINGAVNTVLNHLRKQNPNTKLGKLGLSGFSGGYGPIAEALNKQNLPNLVKVPDAVVVADGIHHGPAGMAPWLDYARLAAQDPSKKFVALHTEIDPVKYPSSTETADYILQQIGLTRQNIDPKYFQGWNVQPKNGAVKGGLTILQIPGNGKQAHWNAAEALPYLWRTLGW